MATKSLDMATNHVLGSTSQDFPLIFHGVTGIDEREESSPSFFNVAEVEVLMDYVRKLLQSNGKKGHGNIAPREIGIIAPYRKQVCITLTRPKYKIQVQIVQMCRLKELFSYCCFTGAENPPGP